MSGDKEDIRKMADLLRRGATMLAEQCPECYSPLFRIGEEIWCPRCNKQVIKVKREEEQTVPSPKALGTLEETLIGRIAELESRMRTEKDLDGLRDLVSLTLQLVELLDKIRKLDRNIQ